MKAYSGLLYSFEIRPEFICEADSGVAGGASVRVQGGDPRPRPGPQARSRWVGHGPALSGW